MARLLFLPVVTVAVAVVSAAQAGTPVVPVATQARIAKVRPSLAYAPTRMLIGFRFRSWRTGPAAVYERFTNKAGWEITFVAAPLRGTCRAGRSKTFQLDGNKVYWSQTRNEQQAWRCVRNRGGLWVRLVAAQPAAAVEARRHRARPRRRVREADLAREGLPTAAAPGVKFAGRPEPAHTACIELRGQSTRPSSARVWGGLHYRSTVEQTSKDFPRIARDVGEHFFLPRGDGGGGILGDD